MVKRGLIIFLMTILMISSFALAQEIDVTEDEIYQDVEDATLGEDAGLTPDDTFYFVEVLLEDVLLAGDNPERALKYKDEKISELKEMVKAGKVEEAKKILQRTRKYTNIIEKEVTPDIEKDVRRSSKATKDALDELDLEDNKWDDIKEDIQDHKDEEDKLAKAAKVSSKIKELCEQLAKLDPLEYSRVCRTKDDDAKWKRNLDRDLTAEQEKNAKEFFGIMSQCFTNPNECRCDDISIKPFADQCKIIAPLAAKCEAGDEQACQDMEDVEDPIDLLPDYLQDVMDDVEDSFGEAQFDLHMPKECQEAGATTKDACMKVMFAQHAPEECQEALESGDIDTSNERKAREQCEEIMFNSEAPPECIDAGIRDHKECGKHMFRLDAPQECVEAGLTGEGRNDWKECDLIRFKLDAPQACLDAGITGEGRNDWKKCEAINFRLDSPQECLDAGLTGEGRDDWKECDAIRFKLEAPQECLDAGIDPRDRRAWDKCKPIQFKAEVPQECLDAGLTGQRQSDWRDCQKIQFKMDAPQECLDAGITGEGRDDWKKCDSIRQDESMEGPDGRLYKPGDTQGERREDCGPDDIHTCDQSGYCQCLNKEDYDQSQQPDDHGGPDYQNNCANIYCPQDTYCDNGACKPFDNQPEPFNECKDGCSQECPGADRTDCVNGNQCVCFYNEKTDDGHTEPNPDPEASQSPIDDGSPDGSDGSNDGHTDPGTTEPETNDGSSDSGTDSNTDSGSDSGSSDSGSSESGSDDSGQVAPSGLLTGGVVYDNDFLDYLWS
jgi:hypothetical protein